MTESQSAPEPQPEDEPIPKTALCWIRDKSYEPGETYCDPATEKVWRCQDNGEWDKTTEACIPPPPGGSDD